MVPFVDLLPILLLLGVVGILVMFLLVLRSLAAQRELLREGLSRQHLLLAALEAKLQEALRSGTPRTAPARDVGVIPANPHDLSLAPANPRDRDFAPTAPDDLSFGPGGRYSLDFAPASPRTRELDLAQTGPHDLDFVPAVPQEEDDLATLLDGVEHLPPVETPPAANPASAGKLPSLDAPFGGNGRPSAAKGSLDLKLDS